jgi:peptidoglycan L-alanyl-D-glutamate endopeptidase CwlK
MAASIKVASEKIGKALRSASPVLGAILLPAPFVLFLIALNTGSLNEPVHSFFPEKSPWNSAQGTLNIERQTALPSAGLSPHTNLKVNQNIDDLQPEFKLALTQILLRLQQQGHTFKVVETLRSTQRQNELFEQGRTSDRPGLKVTNARANESAHQFGLAADLAPVIDGMVSLDVSDPRTQQAFDALGKESVAHGLVWGGHWKILDWGHIEMRPITSGRW